MKVVEKRARTVEDAIDAAVRELNTKRDRVEIEVLEEGNRGFLGILGGKDARVRVTYKPVIEEKKEHAERLLSRIIGYIGISASVEGSIENESVCLNIHGEDLGLVIGHRGETLDALQYLIGLATNKLGDEWVRVLIDAEGYRAKREETLRRLAQRLAEKVRSRRRKAVLEPMSAADRRIIHVALQDDGDVETYSEGRDPYRYVVIVPK